MIGGWLDLAAALAVVGLAAWWLVRSLRAPSSCAGCPPNDGDVTGLQGGVMVPINGLGISRRHPQSGN